MIDYDDLFPRARTVLPLWDWCQTQRLPRDGGPRAGELFDPAEHPVHAAILRAISDACASGKWGRFVLRGITQDGKTLLLGYIAAWYLSQYHDDALVMAYPTRGLLEKQWRGKYLDQMRAADLVPDSGPGSDGGLPLAMVTTCGSRLDLIGAGTSNEGARAGTTDRAAILDELDDFSGRRGSDADARRRIDQVVARTDAHAGRSLVLLSSTVKADRREESNIDAEYADSTQGRWAWPCPHCAAWPAWGPEHLHYDPTDDATALATGALACPHCGAVVTDDQRRIALTRGREVHAGQVLGADGRLTGQRHARAAWGMAWTAAESPFRSMGVIAQKHLRAIRLRDQTGLHAPLRQWYRDHWGAFYTGDTQTDEHGLTVIPTRNRLAALSTRSPYGLAVDRTDKDADSIHLADLPAWVEHQTMAVDVQRGGDRAPGRLYFLAIGRGQGKGAITAWGSIAASPIGRQPTAAELHAALDRLDGLLRDWSPAAPIVAHGVDVGDRQDELLPWIRARRAWWAIKGTGPLRATDPGDRPGWLYRRRQDRGWTLRLIETRACLSHLHGELMTETLLLPLGLDRESALLRHLCATVEYAPGKWSQSPKDRIHHPEWQTRDDYGQCAAYARALAYDWEQRAAAPAPTAPIGRIGSFL